VRRTDLFRFRHGPGGRKARALGAPETARREEGSLRGLFALFFVMAVLIMPFAARAADEGREAWERIRSTHLLRLGFPGDYAPFALAPEGKTDWQGFDVDLLRGFAARHHLTAVFVRTSWKTLAADLARGSFDIAGGGISVTPERARIGLFSEPYLEDGKTVIAPCATAGRFASLAAIDQPGVRILVNPGGTNEAFDRRFLTHARLVWWEDNRSIFAALARGEGDLMITDATEARYQTKLHPELCAPFAAHPFTHSEKAFFLTPDPRLKAALDAFLEEERRTGRLDALKARWFGRGA
jgi:cyclohexadienyl dehydratase